MNTEHIEKQRQAIIWGRFSSEKQSDGDSRERQERNNRDCAKLNRLRIVAEHFDPAASVKDGATPLFKNVIAELASGIGIICENLDRISREHPWKQKNYIYDIIKDGHFIITSQDGMEYNEETINLIGTLATGDLQTNLANAENVKRTKRVREEQGKAIGLAREGKAAPLGAWLPAHIKFNPDTNSYDIRKDRKEVIQFIFDQYAKGEGVTSITKQLNDKKTITFRGKKVGAWTKTTVFALLRYEGLIGLLNIKGERIPNAFSPAIKEKLFYQVQKMLETNKTRHGKYSSKNVNNIFRGVCKCKYCSGSMRVTAEHYIGCNNFQVSKCKIKNMMPFREMEFEFAKWFIPQAKDALFGKDTSASSIETLETKRTALQGTQSSIMEQWDGKTAFNLIQSKLAKIESELNGIVNEIAALKAEQSANAVLPETLKELNTLLAGIIENQEVRKKVAALVPAIVKEVVIDIADKNNPSFVCELVNNKKIEWIYSPAKVIKDFDGKEESIEPSFTHYTKGKKGR